MRTDIDTQYDDDVMTPDEPAWSRRQRVSEDIIADVHDQLFAVIGSRANAFAARATAVIDDVDAVNAIANDWLAAHVWPA